MPVLCHDTSLLDGSPHFGESPSRKAFLHERGCKPHSVHADHPSPHFFITLTMSHGPGIRSIKFTSWNGFASTSDFNEIHSVGRVHPRSKSNWFQAYNRASFHRSVHPCHIHTKSFRQSAACAVPCLSSAGFRPQSERFSKACDSDKLSMRLSSYTLVFFFIDHSVVDACRKRY